MQPGKYKMKKNPNLLRPFLNTFNLFISFLLERYIFLGITLARIF